MVVTALTGLTTTSEVPAVDIRVINPAEFDISRNSRTVAGSAYGRLDADGNSNVDVRTMDYNVEYGEYRIVIRPNSGSAGGAFTMDIRIDGSHQIKSYSNYMGAFSGRIAPGDQTAGDSLVFYYTVEPVPSMNPPNGERTTTTRQPVFVWSKLMDSTAGNYQFQLDDNYYFESPLKDTTPSTPSYAMPVPLDTGTVYYWRARVGAGSWSRTMAAYIGDGCCIASTGNVNTTGSVDLSDLSLMIAYLVQTPRPTLPCQAEANINSTGSIDLSDLSLLIAYLTVTPRPSLSNCP
jgi:hypothetical protein